MPAPVFGVITLTKPWRSPASAIKRGKHGIAEIMDFRYGAAAYECYGVRGAKYYRLLQAAKITMLKLYGQVWMVDDPTHYWAMEEHAAVMSGHVLVGGLGLGLIAHTLAANPKVERITIVEREPDVIKLVQPYIPERCRVVEGNFWAYDDPEKVDGVVLDILVGKGKDLKGIATRQYLMLRQKFGPDIPIRIHGFNNSFMEKLAQAKAASELFVRNAMELIEEARKNELVSNLRR